MRTEYFITMDAHSRTSDICVKTKLGKLVRREHLPTTIPHLVEFIEAIPRPRRLSFEESSIAGWLYRNLHERTDEVIVCDPRRNGYVARDGDKDDPIDAEKLNDLYRGGFLRPVHQQDTAEKAAVKQMIGMYHNRVGQGSSERKRSASVMRRTCSRKITVQTTLASSVERHCAIGQPSRVSKPLRRSKSPKRNQSGAAGDSLLTSCFL